MNGFRFAYGALSENVGLPFEVSVLVQNFKRGEQTIAAVLPEGSSVCAAADKSVLPSEFIISGRSACSAAQLPFLTRYDRIRRFFVNRWKPIMCAFLAAVKKNI